MWALLAFTGLILPNVLARREHPGVISTSEHLSGELCGLNQRGISSAICSGAGHCICPARTWGDGSFACYPQGSKVAEIKGDHNTLRSFNNTYGEVNLPCRIRFTEFKTYGENGRPKCHFQVFGANQNIGGMTLLTTVEVHVLITHGSFKCGLGIRYHGTANNRVFKYKEWWKNRFSLEPPVTCEPDDLDGSGHGDGDDDDDDHNDDDDDHHDDNHDWGLPDKNNLKCIKQTDSRINRDNFVVIKSPYCGTKVLFRAPNIDQAHQSQTPGLAVVIDNTNDKVVFPSPLTYLAESPDLNGLRPSASRNG